MPDELPDAPWATKPDLPDAPWAAPKDDAPPESFLHRLATGMMLGGNKSPEELQQKGMGDFDYTANVAETFKAGYQNFVQSKTAGQRGAGLLEAAFSPITAALQAAGGLVEKGTGGLIPNAAVQDALMLATGPEGAAGRISRVRNGTEQVIGDLPKAGDFENAAAALNPDGKGLRLVAAPEGGVYGPEQIKPGEKYFKALDRDGNTAAEMLVKIDGTTAKVEDIMNPALIRTDGRNAIGTSQIRSLLRQFQEQHPEVTEITGKRVSGARVGGGYDLDSEATTRLNLRDLWQERGIHPAEAAHDAQADAFLKHDLTTPVTDPAAKLPAEDWTAAGAMDHPYEMPPEDSGKPAGAAGADVTRDMPDFAKQPPPPAGSLAETARAAMDQAMGLGRNIQGLLDPMATGSNRAMVVAKDAMNTVRRIRWEHYRLDQEIMTNPEIKAARDALGETQGEQLARMWNAADEESVAIQLGESREHQGLVTLDPAERAMVERLHANAQAAWLHVRDVGMVEGDGLPAYTPRMVLNVGAAAEHGGPQALNDLGRNVFTRTSQMLHRNHMTAEETEAAARAIVGKRMAERGASVDEINAALEKVAIARNIRALPLATARLEEAAVWHEMINKIEDMGKATGEGLVAPFKPDSSWFTVAGNPAFTKWRPHPSGTLDDAGRPIWVPMPVYLPGEFRGPMRAILDEGIGNYKVVPGAQSLYGAAMAIKGKAMTTILNSPLIHNEVVWSKAMEAAGGREWLGFGLYFRGNRIVNNPGRSSELIERGLNWMGPRGSIQDITGMQETPNLAVGQSWTAKVLAAVPGLFDEAAGTAVKAAVDKAGNFWHNTLLWDRVRDLQFGLADHLSDRLVSKGADRLTADRIATHFSNIIVGSIPKEAMSASARATANMMLFSRSFTLGNLATFKQAALGLPKPILAQIERDHGFNLNPAKPGTPEPAADVTRFYRGEIPGGKPFNPNIPAGNYFSTNKDVAGKFGDLHYVDLSKKDMLGVITDANMADSYILDPRLSVRKQPYVEPQPGALGQEAADSVRQTAQQIARRKAISTVVMSAGLYYVGNAVIQHAFNMVANDSTLEQEMNGYAKRYQDLMSDAAKDPFELRHLVGRLSPTYDNEPQKQDRAHVGYDKDGTAIYARNPMGKFGEEMVGYPTMPLEMIKRKLSPLAGGILETLENDKGFGKKIYDPNDMTLSGDVNNAFSIAKHLVMKHLPEGQINAGLDLLRGEGDKTTNQLRLFGPAFGFTASVGAPGGPARGEQLAAKDAFESRFNIAWPDIRKQIQRGDVDGAREALKGMGVPNGMQNGLIKSATNPAGMLKGRTLRDFYQYATPAQKARLEEAR